MGGGAGHMPMAVMGPSSGSYGRGMGTVPGGRGMGPIPGGRGVGTVPGGRYGPRTGDWGRGYGPRQMPTAGGCESGRGRGCRPSTYPADGPRYPRFPVVYGSPGFQGPVVYDDDDDRVPVARPRRTSVTPVSQGSRRITPPPPAGPTRSAASPTRRSGLPPSGENRFVPDQVVCVLRADLTERGIDRFLRDNRLARTTNGSRRLALLNARVFRYRITDGRPVRTVIAALQRDRRVVTVQPNYVFDTAEADLISRMPPPVAPAEVDLSSPQAAVPAAATASAASGPAPASQQYAVDKLHLAEAHRIARGERVLVAVIDSGIDTAHPELAGAIAKSVDLVEDGSAEPHAHGTAMAGAIAAKAQLTGVAPAAQVVALRAFSASGKGASSTSFLLVSAVDRAVQEGARVINLSFAGPNDPMLSEALKRARAKNIVLVAAAGNAGPSSPPLYPAADPSVIAVTATDENDKIFAGANRGRYIAVAAPGVDVLVPEPRGSYGLSTGTSVAAAHISGVAALLLARNPSLDPDGVKQILRRSARSLGETPPEAGGAGLADAFGAVTAADRRAAPGNAAAGDRRR